jgi:outer membrane lipoprotein SlyB
LTGNTNNASLWTAIVRRCFGGDPIGDRRVILLTLFTLEYAMENTTRNTHPMIIVAAVAVTIASLAAVASFTGLLPDKSAPETALTAAIPPPPPLPLEAAPVPAPPPATANKAERFAPPPPSRAHKTQPAARDNLPPTGDLRHANESATATYPPNNAGIDVIQAAPASAPPLCHDCGTVEAVREISKPAEGSGLGAIAGGVLGGLLGNQIGRGKGNTAATIVGAVGGGVAGHQVEKQVRAEKQSQITVRFEDGSTRTLAQESGSRWQVGDRVRLSNGSLLPN